ncbi:MAG TPA: glycosyltransferase [Flavobacteriales bacterium]|nr:glycosyltransferase [Flavobacteriales bacterium]
MLSVLPSGSVIHLVTLEKVASPGVFEAEPGIRVHAFRYKRFGALAIGMILNVVWSLFRLVRKERIDTIHAWCTPAGMLGHIISVITGRPLVLDSYEPHAEAMVENGTWSARGGAFNVLFNWERWQSKRAKVLIAAAEGMHSYAALKFGVSEKPMYVKPACVDLDRFSFVDKKNAELLRELGLDGRLILVYAGKFGGIYLDQEVFDLFKVAHTYWGDRFRVLLLTGHSREELLPFMLRAGLDPALFTILSVPPAQVPAYMGLGDMAITPVRSVPTKRYCSPIKDGEYWALGLPIFITPDISDDSRIIAEHGVGVVIEGYGSDAYHRAVHRMDELLRMGDGRFWYDRIRPLAERYRNFDIAENIYKKIYGEHR